MRLARELLYIYDMRTIVVCALAAAFLASPAAAQEPEDFLLGAPKGSAAFRFGWALNRAEGEVFDFFNEELTLESSDFRGPVIGFDVGIALHRRIDVVIGVEYQNTGVDSEFRDFEDLDGLPIEQRTELTIVPVTGSVKLYLTERGRTISRFAFVPNKVRPYVGGGAGFQFSRLRQFGDFVDFETLDIFTDTFESSAWGFQTHAFGGVEVGISPKWFLSFEGRYQWASADLGDDFSGFEPLDLNGLRVTVAIGATF